MNKKGLMSKIMMLIAVLLLMNVGSIQAANSNYHSDDGGDDGGNNWGEGDRGIVRPTVFYQSLNVFVINATAGDDIEAKIIDGNNTVVLSEVIAAEDTSYFTIYVGNLPSGTYQMVLSIDGVDYLFWPFTI